MQILKELRTEAEYYQTALDVPGKKQSSASCQLKRTKYYIQTDIL